MAPSGGTASVLLLYAAAQYQGISKRVVIIYQKRITLVNIIRSIDLLSGYKTKTQTYLKYFLIFDVYVEDTKGKPVKHLQIYKRLPKPH